MKTSISLFLFFAVSFYFQPAMAEQAPLTITTGWGAMTGTVIIAQKKGFFREQGLKTTTLSMSGTRQAFQAYLQGKAGATTINALNIVRSNCDVSHHVIIGTLSYTDKQLKLLARKSAGITGISDLKGKKIAVPRAGFAHFYLEKFLLFNGLTLDDVEEVFVGKKRFRVPLKAGWPMPQCSMEYPLQKQKKFLGMIM